MDAYHINFLFPQPGSITVIADNKDAALEKLNNILNATSERSVVVKDVVSFRDIPQLQAVLIQQDQDMKAMQAEYERIVNQAVEDEKAREASASLAEAVDVEIATDEEAKTIN